MPALRRPTATRHRPRGQGGPSRSAAPASEFPGPRELLWPWADTGPVGRIQEPPRLLSPSGEGSAGARGLRAQLSWQIWVSRGWGRGARSQGSSSSPCPAPESRASRMEAKDASGCRARPVLCGAQAQGTQLRTPELTGPRRTVPHPSLENDLQREQKLCSPLSSWCESLTGCGGWTKVKL